MAMLTLEVRFNGATAMKPWKSLVSTSNAGRRHRLQWGHGDEAVEEDPTRKDVASE